MNKHKWHKEIKAWADGKTIQVRWNSEMNFVKHDWHDCDGLIDWDLPASDFRIKPQQQQSSCCPCKQTCSALKEPQYLYVFETENGIELGKAGQITRVKTFNAKYKYIGKIKLEVDDE